MTLTSTDVAWAAGLYEGEGSSTFYVPKSRLAMQVQMTDRDVVERFHRTWNGVQELHQRPGTNHPTYTSELSGCRAYSAMVTMYPLLGERRQRRIREVVTAWLASPVIRRRCHARTTEE